MYQIVAVLVSFTAQAIVFYGLTKLELPSFVVLFGGFAALIGTYCVFYRPIPPFERRWAGKIEQTP